MDYEAEDKAALHRALLALRQCPFCRRDLVKVRSLMSGDLFECDPPDNDHDPVRWKIPHPVVAE